MFFYAAAGARLAVIGREAKFFAGLLLGCEVLTYISALCYFVLHYELYGNPNSLGVVMGVGIAPVMLWGVIVSQGTRSYKRKLFVLLLCLLLLLHSYARAAIGAACISSFLLCFGLRRYRLLMQGVALGLLAAIFTAFLSPLPDIQSKGVLEKLTDTYLFKGDREQRIFNSRKHPGEDFGCYPGTPLVWHRVWEMPPRWKHGPMTSRFIPLSERLASTAIVTWRSWSGRDCWELRFYVRCF